LGSARGTALPGGVGKAIGQKPDATVAGIRQHLHSRLGHQVAERRQGDELAGGEEFVEVV